MKWLNSLPYPYVIAFISLLFFSVLYSFVDQYNAKSTTNITEQKRQLQGELDKLNTLIVDSKNAKMVFTTWLSAREHQVDLHEYLTTPNGENIVNASEHLSDIDSDALISKELLLNLKNASTLITKTDAWLSGTVKTCDQLKQCYFYVQHRALPVSKQAYSVTFSALAAIYIIVLVLYLKLRFSKLKQAIGRFADLEDNAQLPKKFNDDLSALTSVIDTAQLQYRANQSQLAKELAKFDELSSQLQSQYARLSAVINTVIDGIITIDKDGTVETFNPAAERIFGYQAKQVIGKNVKMLMPTPYQEEHDDYLQNYLTTGKKRVIGSGREVVGQKADGELFPMELSVSEMNVDGERMFTGIVRDISDIAEQKSLLNDQVSRIKAIIETVIDGIITIDEQGVVDSLNPAAEKIFGYKEREVVGNNIKMLMPSPYQQEHDQYLHNYRTSGIKKVIGSGREVLGQRKDGSVFPMSLAISEMNIDNKRMFTGIVRDITERKKYETALNQYRDTLEEQVEQRTAQLEAASQQAQSANEAKSKFLSRMSHELRTPLNAIIGFTQILEDETLTESQQDSLKEIAIAGKDLMSMVNDILQITAIQSGDLNLSKEEVALNDVISEATKLLALDAKAKNITVQFNCQSQYFVTADYSKLKQVLTSLIDNAIQYNQPNGSVEIDIAVEDDKVKVSITDTGKGISTEQLKTIFAPFERVSDEHSGEEGIGIGLTIVKELVEAMDGEVGALSTLKQGATFFFTLPLLREVESHVDTCLHVLYIEDNATNRKLMKRLINKIDNIDYHEAIDGTSGIAATKQYLPNLVLLDINLPDMSGYDVFKALRDDDSTKNIPVVGVSANAMESDKEKAKELGFTDYITKPIELDELTANIEKLIVR